MRRRWHDETEHRPAPEPVEALPLFSSAPAWPEVRPAEAENHVLPIGTTIEASYRAWRATEDGERVWEAFCGEAVGEVARGATRLSGKAIWERVRARLRLPMNNNHHALVVRDAEIAHPSIAGLFEKRMRRAS